MKEKDEYLQRIQSQLTKWTTDIDILEAKARVTTAEARSEYVNELEKLKAKSKQLEKQVDEVKNSAGDAWQELAAGVDKAWQELSEGLQSAVQRFK